MKKVFIALVVAAASVLAVSCSKDAKCKCVTEVAGVTQTVEVDAPENGDCAQVQIDGALGVKVKCTRK